RERVGNERLGGGHGYTSRETLLLIAADRYWLTSVGSNPRRLSSAITAATLCVVRSTATRTRTWSPPLSAFTLSQYASYPAARRSRWMSRPLATSVSATTWTSCVRDEGAALPWLAAKAPVVGGAVEAGGGVAARGVAAAEGE